MEGEKTINNDINSDNIFKELSGELDFGHTDEDVKVEVKKGKIYYLSLYGNIFSMVNIVAFVILVLLMLFVKVQNNSQNYSQSFLDPFCFVVLGDFQANNTGDYCSSVAALVADYDAKITQLKSDITQNVSSIISELYVYESFVESKEVSFLLNKNSNRLNIVDMLNDFDRLKLDFSGMDKKRIVCSDLKADEDGFLDINCEVYSSSWEVANNTDLTGIIGSSGDIKSGQLQGSSISVAASFLNFIEKNPQYNFQIIEKQKQFQSNTIVGEGLYVKSTPLQLKLKYNNLKNNLSL